MRIVIASDFFMKVISGQVAAFRSLGHEVLLVCRDHATEFGGDEAERNKHIAEMGIPVIELPGRRLEPTSVADARAARKRVREFNPDAVLVHDNLDPRMLMAVRGFPIAYLIHDAVPHPGAAPTKLVLRPVSWAWKRAATTIVVHGERIAELLPADLKSRKPVSVIPLGSVVLRKVPLAAPPALNVLLFGRLEPYKGVGVLVEAMKTVWESHPEATLTVAGRGPAAAEVPTDARVNLMDHYIPEAEIESLFASASVCVLPYTEASQSGVGLQSLSMGVPTVVTDVGALPELAENESRLVPPSEPKILGEAIVTALASGLAERESTLEFARERFSWETVAKQYEDLFRSIARNRPIG